MLLFYQEPFERDVATGHSEKDERMSFMQNGKLYTLRSIDARGNFVEHRSETLEVNT